MTRDEMISAYTDLAIATANIEDYMMFGDGDLKNALSKIESAKKLIDKSIID